MYDTVNFSKYSGSELGVRTPGSASVLDAENEVMADSTCSSHFQKNRPWDFLFRIWIYKNTFSLPMFVCLYGLLSIPNYSNPRIWSVRTRNVANIVWFRLLRVYPQRSTSVGSNVSTSIVRKKWCTWIGVIGKSAERFEQWKQATS